MLGDEGGGVTFYPLPRQVVAASVYPEASLYSRLFFLQEFVQRLFSDVKIPPAGRAVSEGRNAL